MNFKLTNLATINEKYGRTMEQLKDTTWEVFFSIFTFIHFEAKQEIKKCTFL